MSGPRVAPADIEANIASEWYFTGAEAVGQGNERQPPVPSGHPLQLLTFCVLVLRNGFTVTGESACVSHANFDAQKGREIARGDAFDKIWPLMGYALKENLHYNRPLL